MKIKSSVKNGSHNWLMQRISALALIPLVIWLVLSVIKIILNPIYIPIFFAYHLNAFMGILFVIFSLYHGSLGMKEVIEDYVQGSFKKHFYIMLFHFISIVTATAVILAILRLHLVA